MHSTLARETSFLRVWGLRLSDRAQSSGVCMPLSLPYEVAQGLFANSRVNTCTLLLSVSIGLNTFVLVSDKLVCFATYPKSDRDPMLVCALQHFG